MSVIDTASVDVPRNHAGAEGEGSVVLWDHNAIEEKSAERWIISLKLSEEDDVATM